MSYHLQISERDRTYLDGLPLSNAAREKIDDFIEYAIEQVDDGLRTNPENRPKANTPFFERVLLLMDEDVAGNRSFHTLRFVINDAKAAFGVLILAYVEHQ